MRLQNPSVSRRRRRQNSSRRQLTLLVFALLLAGLFGSLELGITVDTMLHRGYAKLEPQPQISRDILLVEVDDATYQSWGPPPWELQRYTQLEDAITQGQPQSIAVVHRGPLFVGHKSVHPSVSQGSNGHINNVYIDPTLRDTHLWSLLGAAPPSRPTAVHFSGNHLTVAKLPAHRVARGDIPPATFQRKTVLIGVTSNEIVQLLATPAGLLSPAEIASQSLVNLRAGNRSRPLHWLLNAAIVVGLSVAASFALCGLSPKCGVTFVVALSVGLVLLDMLLYLTQTGELRLAVYLVALWLLASLHWLNAHLLDAEALQRLSQSLAVQFPERPPERVATRKFWQDLHEVAHGYIKETTGGVLAELPDGKWHLEVRSYYKTLPQNLVERRRDIRRPPFRASYLTLRASVAERQIMSGTDLRTHVVPLIHNDQVLGVWLLNSTIGTQLSPTSREQIERSGREMGAAIAKMRQTALAQSASSVTSIRTSEVLKPKIVDPDFRQSLGVIQAGIQTLSNHNHQQTQILEQLPFGIIVATMWGEIIEINERMQGRLAGDFPAGVPNLDLRAVLARATGGTLEDAHTMMRQVVLDGEDFQFSLSTNYLLTRLTLRQTNDIRSTHSDSSPRIDRESNPTSSSEAEACLLLIAQSDLFEAANRHGRSA